MTNRPRRGVLVLLVVLAVAPYLSTLAAPLFGDDYLHVENVTRLSASELLLHSWALRIDGNGAWWTPPGFRVDYFRPVVAASFVVDHALWGERAIGYHLTNLGLHVLCVLLVFALARRHLGDGLRAFATAALFAIHPGHAEAVAWVSARTDLLSTAFFLSALSWFTRRDTRPTIRILVGASLLALALGSKEMAITLPLVLALDAMLYSRQWAAPIAATAVAIAYLAFRIHVFGGTGAAPPPLVHGPGEPGYLYAIALGPLVYLVDLALFVPPDPVVTFPFWHDHPLVLLAVVAVAAAAARDAWRHIDDRRLRRYAVAFMAITILPVLPVAVGERFVYLPSVGWCLLLGARLPDSVNAIAPAMRRAYLAVVALVVAVLVAKCEVFGALARHARRTLDDAIAALAAAPNRNVVAVVDLPAAATLAFPSVLRLAFPTRELDIEILSIAPIFLSDAASGPPTMISRDGPRLTLRKDGGGFLDSYFARAMLGRHPPYAVGDVIRRRNFSVRIVDASGSSLRAFTVDLDRPDASLLLRGAGYRLDPL